MQRPFELGICKCCGRKKVIQNKTKGLCSDCVYSLNHGGKSREEVLLEKKKNKKTFKKYVYKKKNTGERELFLEIWNERRHICQNCGVVLGNVPRGYMFSHIRAKSIEPEKRLDKENIRLLCWDCHYALDFRGKEYYEKRSL